MTMTQDECWDIVDSISGHMAGLHVDWLVCVAASLPKGAHVLEIGTGSGRSMAALALGLQEGLGGVLFSVESRPGKHKEALATAHKLTSTGGPLFRNDGKTIVMPMCATSPWGAPIGPFDMVFIDGDHNYPQIAVDFMFGFDHLKGGGILCGHDYGPPQFDTVELIDRYVFGEPCDKHTEAFTDAGLIGKNTLNDEGKVIGGNCIWWGRKKIVE